MVVDFGSLGVDFNPLGFAFIPPGDHFDLKSRFFCLGGGGGGSFGPSRVDFLAWGGLILGLWESIFGL